MVGVRVRAAARRLLLHSSVDDLVEEPLGEQSRLDLSEGRAALARAGSAVPQTRGARVLVAPLGRLRLGDARALDLRAVRLRGRLRGRGRVRVRVRVKVRVRVGVRVRVRGTGAGRVRVRFWGWLSGEGSVVTVRARARGLELRLEI